MTHDNTKPTLTYSSGPYKDKMGRYRTQSLFHEFSYQSDINPLWTLKESHSNIPSLKELYLSCLDPTEYKFAILAFNSWEQWLKIKASKALWPLIEDWSVELEVLLRSKGIAVIAQEAVSGKSAFNAAKYLANAEWKGPVSKRGRPSKDEITREAKIAAKLQAEVGADAQRLGLQLIKGGK